MLIDIKGILRFWGYSANGRLGTEFPCVAAGMKPAVSASNHRILRLTDDSIFEIEKVLGISHSTFKRELAQAEMYVLGVVVGLKLALVV